MQQIKQKEKNKLYINFETAIGEVFKLLALIVVLIISSIILFKGYTKAIALSHQLNYALNDNSVIIK